MKLTHNILSTSGRPWAVQAAGRQFVYFNYNPVGDNTKVYSGVANDWERNYTYDLLGRRLTYTEGEHAEDYTYNGGNLATDIFYYHTNHLGSTAYVTDHKQNITQGFLYAPFGEITTEYAPMWQNGTLPKYSFNAKELDE